MTLAEYGIDSAVLMLVACCQRFEASELALPRYGPPFLSQDPDVSKCSIAGGCAAGKAKAPLRPACCAIVTRLDKPPLQDKAVLAVRRPKKDLFDASDGHCITKQS